MLPTASHRSDISSKGAVFPGCNDAEMGPANSLHASAYYSEYNKKRLDLIYCFEKLRIINSTKKIRYEVKRIGLAKDGNFDQEI